MVKNLPGKAGDMGSIPGMGRFSWRRKWLPTPVGREFGGLQRAGGLQSMWLQRVRPNSVTEHHKNPLPNPKIYPYFLLRVLDF